VATSIAAALGEVSSDEDTFQKALVGIAASFRRASTDAVMRFVQSNVLTFGDGQSVTWREVRAKFEQFCTQQHYPTNIQVCIAAFLSTQENSRPPHRMTSLCEHLLRMCRPPP